MRLWHKDLIPVLPRQQLLGQWRECCLIAREISENGTPNHLLVNKIMDYPLTHFSFYAYWVYYEMKKRGYKCDEKKFVIADFNAVDSCNYSGFLFYGWHNNRYLKQCLYNLQEKYDCGGIPEEEWQKIVEVYGGEWR